MQDNFFAGAACEDISPRNSQFLYGYPHVERYSQGIHDPLLSSALYISNGTCEVMFIANDIIFVSKEIVRNIRKRIAALTKIKAKNIMITATHTHSGPVTVNYISNEADKTVPKADPEYLQFMEDTIVLSAVKAYKNKIQANLGLVIADVKDIGTNRRDLSGPSDSKVPVLMVKDEQRKNNIACMLICSMHPTVLHEDSLLISGDFPGMSRMYLQNILGKECSVLHHTGPCGNQSPRYVVKSNDFQEAQRLGEALGKAIQEVLINVNYLKGGDIKCIATNFDIPRKTFPPVEVAQKKLEEVIKKLEQLRKNNANPKEIRTATCDFFGAEETVTLAKEFSQNRLEKVYQSCLPVEIQVIKIGPWCFVGWPGEIFVEYSLAVKEKFENTFVISLANGELQGYIVTKAAEEEGGYEASNSLFSSESGNIFVSKTRDLLKKING